MEKGLSTLYSNDELLRSKVFEFFKNIEKEIKYFLYIPLLDGGSLCEFKKHLFLGAVTSQLEENNYDSIMEYIFYTNNYFNESAFGEITFTINRNGFFLNEFSNYSKEYQFKLNLENIKDYIFSKTIKEAYLETCKEIFGEDAPFVTMNYLEKALDDIYNNIVKNIKFVKLEKYYYGITIYSKKVFISQSFLNNIKKSPIDRRKVTYLAGLVLTILHEITHCLVNYLPSYNKNYQILSNPFIRTFKKNIKVYDLVVGIKQYNEKKHTLDILKENINNYNLINDSGKLFESKLFNNNKNSEYNYLISEFFLNKSNLNQSLNEFRTQLKTFEKIIATNHYLKELNFETTVCFKQFNGFFYFGNCILDNSGLLAME